MVKSIFSLTIRTERMNKIIRSIRSAFKVCAMFVQRFQSFYNEKFIVT